MSESVGARDKKAAAEIKVIGNVPYGHKIAAQPIAMVQTCSDIQFEGADGITLCRNPIRHIKRKKAEAAFLTALPSFLMYAAE
ncbi:MAG: hypothetical protein V8Q79_08180 [Christensenellales bacterium]